jgi:hypothetical protein
MNSESSLVMEVWEAVRDFVPSAKRTDVAVSILRSVEEFGLGARDLTDLLDEDENLTAAHGIVFGSDEEREEDEVDRYGEEDWG